MERIVDEIRNEVGKASFAVVLCMTILFLMNLGIQLIAEGKTDKQHNEIVKKLDKLEKLLKSKE